MENNNNIKKLRKKIEHILDDIANDGRFDNSNVDEVMQIIQYQVLDSTYDSDIFNSWVNYWEERDGK